MTQERMHPEDLRSIVASIFMSNGKNESYCDAVYCADKILKVCRYTATQPESNHDYRVRLEMERADNYEADLKTARENLKKADDRWANEQEVSARHLAKTIILDARVKELEDEIRRHQISFPSLVRPSKADARLWELVK